MPKLSDPQEAVLRAYATYDGPTPHLYGTMNTWKSLIRMGFLTRSRGLGPIEIEATPAGRAALAQQGD